jgi:hypothetical protein
MSVREAFAGFNQRIAIEILEGYVALDFSASDPRTVAGYWFCFQVNVLSVAKYPSFWEMCR